MKWFLELPLKHAKCAVLQPFTTIDPWLWGKPAHQIRYDMVCMYVYVEYIHSMTASSLSLKLQLIDY